MIGEGWIAIINSRKYHYCINGKTLCRKFMYLGSDYQNKWNGKFTNDDCSGCVKALQKRDSIITVETKSEDKNG